MKTEGVVKKFHPCIQGSLLHDRFLKRRVGRHLTTADNRGTISRIEHDDSILSP